MTSNVNAASAGFAENVYNAFQGGFSAVYHRGLYMPYNAIVEGAKFINSFAGPGVGVAGKIVEYVFNGENHAATSSGLAFFAFGYMTYKGANMVFDPLKCKWIEIDYRFKSKLELKGKLENLAELVNKISPDVLPGTAQVNAIAGLTGIQAGTLIEGLKTAADNAKAEADTAAGTRDRLKTEFNTADDNAKALENVYAPNYSQILAGTAREDATIAKQKYEEACTAAQLAQVAATKAKEKLDTAKKHSETLKPAEPKKEAGKKEDALPEGNYFLNYKVEKSKQKPGEYHLWLPMSNNAIIFKSDVFQQSIKTSLAGMPTFALGGLGLIDSLSKFRAEFPVDDEMGEAQYFASAAAGATETLQTISNRILGDTGEKIAHVIGTPVQWTAGVAVNTVSWALSHNTYGLSKLVAAVALGAGGYSLIKGGFPFYREPINGVWYDIKKAKPDETIFTTARYTLHRGRIVGDIAKAVAGTAMIGAAFFSVHDFMSGNYYS